jgi:hypothetical protein
MLCLRRRTMISRLRESYEAIDPQLYERGEHESCCSIYVHRTSSPIRTETMFISPRFWKDRMRGYRVGDP